MRLALDAASALWRSPRTCRRTWRKYSGKSWRPSPFFVVTCVRLGPSPRQWATDHPIHFYAMQNKESTLNRVLKRNSAREINIRRDRVTQITTTANDIRREIQMYSDHLFRQARWEAELLKLGQAERFLLQIAGNEQ